MAEHEWKRDVVFEQNELSGMDDRCHLATPGCRVDNFISPVGIW